MISPPTLPHRLSPNRVREYLQLLRVHLGSEKCSSYWDFPILVFVEDLVFFPFFCRRTTLKFNSVSNTGSTSGAKFNTLNTGSCLCQAICMVTILVSHDRTFSLLPPPLLY